MQAECMHDVALLLEAIFRDQEPMVKLILDRLYDIGSADVIDQKLTLRPLNRVTKAIAPRMKPLFRVVGFIWFRQKCPALVTNWLYKKVTSGQLLPQLMQDIQAEDIKLEQLEQLEQAPPTDSHQWSALPATVRSADHMRMEQSSQEIRRLRSQVQFLLSALVGTVMILGSTTLWLMRDSMPLLPSADSSRTACRSGASCLEPEQSSRTIVTTGSPQGSSTAP